ncbi:ECF transporter S component [Clostridium polyendosporum]|uniref:ECF transporter S component n=1 Tax=Clostridium polyendosporum TaxID=69208 RepID=UPI0038994188
MILLGLFFKFNVSEKNWVLTIGTASIFGTLANTIGVLSLVHLIYIERFANVIKISPDKAGKFIIGIGITNGIPEALISAIITMPVVIAVLKIRK